MKDQVVLSAYETWLFSGGGWQETLSDLRLDVSDKQLRIAESLEILPFQFKYGGIDISASWIPNWDRRTWFKTEIMREFEKQISDRQSLGKVIPVGTKSRFANKLKSYMERMDLIDNKNFYKLPRKKIVENHFLALIEYQIPPCHSYRKLARKYGVDLKTIRRDLTATAMQIGLTPRKPTPPGVAERLGEKFKREGEREFQSGHLGANISFPFGSETRLFDIARYLGVRESFITDRKPKGGIELSLIDMMTQAYFQWQHWLEQTVKRSQTSPNEEHPDYLEWQEWRMKQRRHLRPFGNEFYKPTLDEAQSLEQAFQLADKWNRLYMRTLRQLRDLRRYAPVLINNAEQVNIAGEGGQQVNVSNKRDGKTKDFRA